MKINPNDLKVFHPRCVRSTIQDCNMCVYVCVYIYIYISVAETFCLIQIPEAELEDPRNCTSLPPNTGLPSSQVPFTASFTVFKNSNPIALRTIRLRWKFPPVNVVPSENPTNLAQGL